MAFQFKQYEPKTRDELLGLLEDSYTTENKDFSVLEKDFPCGPLGEIPLLGKAGRGRLVLVEIVKKEGEFPLSTLLGKYKWLRENRSIIARIFKGEKVDDTSEPVLLVFAPSSRIDIEEVVSFLNLPRISLSFYTCLEMEGKRGALLEEACSWKNKEEHEGTPQQEGDNHKAKKDKDETEAIRQLAKKVAAG